MAHHRIYIIDKSDPISGLRTRDRLSYDVQKPPIYTEEPEPKWRHRGLIIVFSALAAWLFVIAVGAAFWFLVFSPILHLIARMLTWAEWILRQHVPRRSPG